MGRNHQFVLGLRVPMYVIAKVDAPNADLMQVRVIRVAILPNVRFLKCFEDREQIVSFVAHQVIVLAVTT